MVIQDGGDVIQLIHDKHPQYIKGGEIPFWNGATAEHIF